MGGGPRWGGGVPVPKDTGGRGSCTDRQTDSETDGRAPLLSDITLAARQGVLENRL